MTTTELFGDNWLFDKDSLELGALEIDLVNGKIRISNRWAQKIISREHIQTVDFSFWTSLVPLEDHHQLGVYLDPDRVSVSDAGYSEHRLILPDKQICWVFIQGSVFAYDNKGIPSVIKAIIKDISERKKAEYSLKERVKELGCLESIADLLARNDLAVDEILQECVNVIPSGWQFPEKTVSRIQWKERIFPTDNYVECKHKLTFSGFTENGNECLVEVGYLPDFPITAVDPFLPEEHNLIHLINAKLVQFIDRVELIDEITLKEGELNFVISNINDIIYEIDNQNIIKSISPSVERILGYPSWSLIGLKANQWLDSEGNAFLDFEKVVTFGECEGQAKVKRADGTSIWVRNSSRAVFQDGMLISILGSIQDISALKVTEAELVQSQEMYASILHASPDAITITDLEGYIEFSSPRAVTMFGAKSVEDFSGHKTIEFLMPSDRERALKAITDMYGEIRRGGTRYKAIKFDGTTFDIEVNGEFIRDAEGNPIKMIFVTRDITSRIALENEIEESHRNLNLLMNNLKGVAYRCENDSNWTMSFISDGIEELTGYPSSDFINNTVRDYNSVIYDEDKMYVWNEIQKSNESRSTYTLEYRIVTNEGSIRWVWEKGQAIYEGGDLIALEGFISDITDRKNAEEKLVNSEKNYKNLFYNAPDGYLLLNEGRIIECNKAFERLLKGDRTQIIGKRIEDISPEFQLNGKSSRELAADSVAELIVSGNNSFEWIHMRFDGSTFPANVDLSIMEYENKEVVFAVVRDLTAQKASEERIRKLSTAIEQSPVSIVITDLEGKIEYANRSASLTTGYSYEELVGQNPRVLKSGETSDDEYSHLWHNITSGQKWRGIFHNRRKNGELYWESSTISPITNEKGEITHFLAVKEDITERKNIQEALEINEKRFTQVAEHSKTVIWEVDSEGLYTYLSPVSKNLYGYDPEELIGKVYFYDLHPEEVRDSFKQAGLGMIQSGKDLINFDNPILRKDSQVIWVSTNGSPIFDQEKNIIGYRGADIDITERKIASEELKKFRTISDQANYGNAIANLDGILLYCNDAFAQMHGYEVNELVGQHLSMLHDEQQIIKVQETIELLRENGQFSAEEVWRTRKDGTVFPSLMNGMLILNDDGVPVYLAATAIDITEIKRHEAEINDLNQNLERKVEERTHELEMKTLEADKANRAKSEFLSRMSHELRTPMNSILGFAQLLEMADLSPAYKRSVHHILKSGNLLLNLINEVLDISRIEAGRLSLSMEPVLVEGVIEEMLDSLQPMFKDKNINVNLIGSQDNLLFIKADKQRLKQIILNLLNNAVKYNRTNGNIAIACERSGEGEAQGKWLRISITDTGIGIAEEDLGKLFQPFERIGAERTETEGTGLGLAVVKKLVDAMGGFIGVQSTKDVGSTFWIEFPLTAHEDNGVVHDKSLGFAKNVEGKARGSLVYIEDNKPNIELVEQIVQTYCPDIHLITHQTGAGAKELVRMIKPDLVLLDLNLPEKDGDIVLTELKTDDETREIPVVVISADAMPKKIHQLMKQGALQYLTKPLDVPELIGVLQKYFGSR